MPGQRGWMIGAVLVTSMAGGAASNLLLTARLGAQGADVVNASQVNLIDSEGRLRAVLAADDERGMASLAFYGPDGSLRGLVGTEPNGTPVLRFNDAAGVDRLSASVRNDEPVIRVGDQATPSVVMGSFGNTPVVGIFDRGRPQVQMTLGGQGEPRLSLFNAAGQRGVGLVVGADDAPFLYVFDAAGGPRLAMGTLQGSTVVNLGDGTRPRLVLGVADTGRPSIAFYDAEGAIVRDVSADPPQ